MTSKSKSIRHWQVSSDTGRVDGVDNDESSPLSDATAPAKKKPKTRPQSPTSQQYGNDSSSSSCAGKTDLQPWIRLLQQRPTQSDPPEQMMEWLDQVYRVSESYWKNSSNNNRIPPVMALSADSERKVDESLTSSSSENGREGGENNKAASSSSDSDSGRD